MYDIFLQEVIRLKISGKQFEKAKLSISRYCKITQSRLIDTLATELEFLKQLLISTAWVECLCAQKANIVCTVKI